MRLGTKRKGVAGTQRCSALSSPKYKLVLGRAKSVHCEANSPNTLHTRVSVRL